MAIAYQGVKGSKKWHVRQFIIIIFLLTLKAFNLLTQLFWLISTMIAVMLSQPIPWLEAMSRAQQSSSSCVIALSISGRVLRMAKLPL